MAILKINGDIIPNDLAWAYDFFGEDYTCPSNVNKVIEALKPGEKLEVKINSPGGSVFAGQEIYTELLNLGDRVIYRFSQWRRLPRQSLPALGILKFRRLRC